MGRQLHSKKQMSKSFRRAIKDGKQAYNNIFKYASKKTTKKSMIKQSN